MCVEMTTISQHRVSRSLEQETSEEEVEVENGWVTND